MLHHTPSWYYAQTTSPLLYPNSNKTNKLNTHKHICQCHSPRQPSDLHNFHKNVRFLHLNGIHCYSCHFWNFSSSSAPTTSTTTTTNNNNLDETCKYLGIEEHDGTDNSQMKDKLVNEYYRHIRQILKTESNSRNKITATNTLATSVLVYSFRIVNWLKKLRR
jgi:hypothetical protein